MNGTTDNKPRRIVQWMGEQSLRPSLAKRCLFGLVHLACREFCVDLGSFRGMLLSVVQNLALVSISTSPVWLKWFDNDTPDTKDFVLAGGLFLLVLTEKISGRTKKYFKDSRQQFNEAVEFGGHLADLWPVFDALDDVNAEKLATQGASLLAIVLVETKKFLGSDANQDLAANLWLFSQSSTKMVLAASTSKRRPTNRAIRSDHLIAYYVAKSGASYVLDDYRALRKAGIASSANPKSSEYRSIYYFPLVVPIPNSSESCCIGVTTVTTGEPFRFWPRRSYAGLETAISPQLALMAGFLIHRRRTERVAVPQGDVV